jgi:phosphoglycerate kinase
MKTIKDFDLKGKQVLVRVDFNEPLDEQGNPLNDYRIVSSLPTLEYLLSQGCRLVIMTHVGRPDGQVVEKYRTTGVARALERLLKRPVIKLDECVGEKVKSTIGNHAAEVYFLENLRFYPEEEAGDETFAEQLAALGDFYVNDAFANCHRDHASMTGIPKFIPGAVGLLVAKEVAALTAVRETPRHPFTFVLGGAKLETKLRLLEQFLQRADNVLIGGQIANTLLKASGIDTGASKIEGKVLAAAVNLIPKINEARLLLPVDVVVSSGDAKTALETAMIRTCAVGDIKSNEIIYDLGPRTIVKYAEIVAKSKLVLWNGPLGYFEKPEFQTGTKGLVEALVATPAETVVGGGETVDFLDEEHVRDKINFVSTGGGAMLDFLADGELIALKPFK